MRSYKFKEGTCAKVTGKTFERIRMALQKDTIKYDSHPHSSVALKKTSEKTFSLLFTYVPIILQKMNKIWNEAIEKLPEADQKRDHSKSCIEHIKKTDLAIAGGWEGPRKNRLLKSNVKASQNKDPDLDFDDNVQLNMTAIE